MTKKYEKVIDELSDTLLSENKSSTKKVDKVTDELANTLLSEKKSSTKDVEKGTDELAFKKQKLNTILRKGLNHFEGKSTRNKVWFKLDVNFFYNFF